MQELHDYYHSMVTRKKVHHENLEWWLMETTICTTLMTSINNCWHLSAATSIHLSTERISYLQKASKTTTKTWSIWQTANLNGFVGGEHDIQALERFLGQVCPRVEHKFWWKVVSVMSQLIINLSTCAVSCHTIDWCHYCLLDHLENNSHIQNL